jgi:hypothetical protein
VSLAWQGVHVSSARPQGTLQPRSSRVRVRPYDVVLAIALGLALALWAITGVPLTPLRPWFPDHLLQLSLFLTLGLIILSSLHFAFGFGRLRRLRPWWVAALFVRYFGLRRLLAAWRYVFAFIVVITIHTSIKQAIPLINGGTTDTALIQIEKAAHFGINPAWDLPNSWAPGWWMTFLDSCYFLWFPSMPLAAAYFVSHRNLRKRDHYLTAFMAIWVIGVLVGLAFPSHGPCYVSPDQFPSPGMDIARMLQTLVWEQYVATSQITLDGLGGLKLGCGLMAMPSMHVTVCCMYCIFFWNEGRLLRGAALAYTVLVFLGSLYSGWHYAIDGYAGLAIAIAATLLTRPLMTGCATPKRMRAADFDLQPAAEAVPAV